MNRRLKQAGVVLVLVFASAQLVRPERATPATDASRAIGAHAGTASRVAGVLQRACNDCHSNRPAWPWFTRIAPVSWAWARGLAEARQAVNFSEWTAYQPDRRRQLLAASCHAASAGTMPGPYSLVRPETRLSAQDIEAICSAARQEDANAARGR